MSDNKPAPVNLSELDKLGIKIENTRLIIPPELSSTKVVHVAQGILHFSKRWQWWFLDCFLDIKKKEGEEAASQLLSVMDYSNGYLHNIISYGSRVAYEARSLDIGFTQYESIAQLPKAEQPAMVEAVKGDRDSGEREMAREETRQKVQDRLHELHAEENGQRVQGRELGEEPPAPVYADCKRCKNCPDCHGTQRVRVT